ncbi:MAG TPA: ABC transporter substrate-binding protein [Bacteroidota bacterium]|nr:ABC transporter substrate-binding protein [Bacteroidota bacterium]
MTERQRALLSSNLRRRDFLRSFGAAVGGIAITHLPVPRERFSSAAANDSPKLSQMPTIGLLVPRSGINPRLAGSVAAGLKLALDQAHPQGRSDPGKLRLEEVGIRPSEAVNAAKTLILDRKADILVGVMNPAVATDLHDFLESNRTFLIIADAGANIVREAEQSPYVFHSTLGYWQSSFAMGEWAVRNIGRKVFVASSFYESGYDALYSFRLGAERAGGKILQTYISHVPPDRMDMIRVMGAIGDARPDFVFASYCGAEALDFARAFTSSASVSRIPLVGSSFMADEDLLKNFGAATIGMRSCLSWAPGLRTSGNDPFEAAFENMMGRPADSFAVLGYDTGQLIVQAVSGAGGDLGNPVRAREAFRSAKFAGPRGVIRMNSESQSTGMPLYLREVTMNGKGVVNRAVDELKATSENDRSVVALRAETRTGWLNAYLNV